MIERKLDCKLIEVPNSMVRAIYADNSIISEGATCGMVNKTLPKKIVPPTYDLKITKFIILILPLGNQQHLTK